MLYCLLLTLLTLFWLWLWLSRSPSAVGAERENWKALDFGHHALDVLAQVQFSSDFQVLV